jgi:hypothetical protein
MGRSAKICRTVSYEKAKKMKKGQVWRHSGSQEIRRAKKNAKSDETVIAEQPDASIKL